MYLTPRQLAKAANQSKYETGRPCKNGHIAYRYTNNGSCSACINGIKANGKPPQFQEENKNIMEHFTIIGLRLFECDYKAFCDIAYGCALLRMPNVPKGVIETRNTPKDRVSETAFYSFCCHEDDIPLLRKAAADMVSARSRTAAKQIEADKAAMLVSIPQKVLPAFGDEKLYDND